MAMGQDMSRLNTPPHWNLWVSCHLTIVHSGRLFGMFSQKGFLATHGDQMEVSSNGGILKSSILVGFSIDFPINHAAIGDGKPMKALFFVGLPDPLVIDFHLTAGLDCQFPGRR